MNGKQQLTLALNEFRKVKDPDPSAYMKLFVVLSQVTRQGSGLVWSQVEEAVKDSVYGAGQWGSGVEDTGPHWSDKPLCDKSDSVC